MRSEVTAVTLKSSGVVRFFPESDACWEFPVCSPFIRLLWVTGTGLIRLWQNFIFKPSTIGLTDTGRNSTDAWWDSLPFLMSWDKNEKRKWKTWENGWVKVSGRTGSVFSCGTLAGRADESFNHRGLMFSPLTSVPLRNMIFKVAAPPADVTWYHLCVSEPLSLPGLRSGHGGLVGGSEHLRRPQVRVTL